MAKLTENFSLKEFECNDGTRIPNKYLGNIIDVAHNLQVLRDYIKKPIHINSAYRHKAYNKSIGGSKRSQHIIGKAVDIRVDGITPKELFKIITKLVNKGLMQTGGLHAYKSFVHYDIRGYKARWQH